MLLIAENDEKGSKDRVNWLKTNDNSRKGKIVSMELRKEPKKMRYKGKKTRKCF